VLLQELIDACAAAGFRQMIGYIDADNAPSLALTKVRFRARRSVCAASPTATAAGPITAMVQRSLALAQLTRRRQPAPGR